jgi:hypothetical protein
MKDVLCEPPIWEDPLIFFQSLDYTWTKRKEGVCRSELINSFISWAIIAIVVGGILAYLYENPLLFAISVLVVLLIETPAILAFKNSVVKLPVEKPVPTESFTSYEQPEEVLATTSPTAKNPFMNVLLDEIKYNPTRPPAEDIQNPFIMKTLDDFFRVQFTSDPTDVFGRSQSQRQFIVMPSTTVPNDVDSYQNWLYRIPGKTCKEGGRDACLPGTDGGPLVWLSAEK